MSFRFRVLMIVDHKWRDLPGFALVKVQLEDHFGISAELIPFSGFEGAMLKLRPHMVVLNHLNGTRNRFIARASRRIGCVVAVLPTEGRPQNNDLMKYVSGEFADTSQVDLWLSWSETVRQVVMEKTSFPGERIRVTGCPRFDFYVPPLRSMVMSRESFIRKYSLIPGKPVVSWATNFILARHVRTNTLDFMVRDLNNLGVGRLEIYSDPVQLAKKDLAVRLRTLDIFKRLCFRFPDVNFVLKPHPHEDMGDYEDFFTTCPNEGLENVALVTQEYIWDVLNASDVLVHRLCTTGIEAWLMGVPSINFHGEDYGAWNVDVEGPSKEAVAGDDLITDESTLAERLNYYVTGGHLPAEKREVQERHIERWFSRVDGNSALRCAQEIARCLDEARPRPRFTGWELGFRPLVKIALNYSLGRPLDTPIRSRIQYRNGIAVDFLGQRDKSVSERDVQFWSSKIRGVLAGRIKGSLGTVSTPE